MIGAGGGQYFAFLLVGSRFLFSQIIIGWRLNQYVVGGRWSVVGGCRSSVVLYYTPQNIMTVNSYEDVRLINKWNSRKNV